METPDFEGGPPTATPSQAFPTVNKEHVLPAKDVSKRRMEFIKSEIGITYRNDSLCGAIMEELRKQRESGTLCDVTIVVNGTFRFPVHRCVLVAYSSHFSACLANSTSSLDSIIEVSVCLEDQRTFGVILDYMYTGKLFIREETVRDLLVICDQFKMTDIQTCCVQHLENSLSLVCWTRIYSLAVEFKLTTLFAVIEQFLSDHFAEIYTSEDFLNLPHEVFLSALKKCNAAKSWVENYLVLEAILNRGSHTQMYQEELPSLLGVLNPQSLSMQNVDQVLAKNKHAGELLGIQAFDDFMRLVQEGGIKDQVSLDQHLSRSRSSSAEVKSVEGASHELRQSNRRKPRKPNKREDLTVPLKKDPVKRKRGRPRKVQVVEPISDGSDEEDNSVDDDVTFDDEDSDEGETDSGKEDKKVKLKSESDRVHTCDKCPKSFKTPGRLVQHQRSHGLPQPLLCELCGFSTLHVASMQIHIRRHNGKKLQCSFEGCDFSTMRKQCLDDHINEVHLGIHNHICSICGKAFTCRKHVQRHERTHLEVKPIKCHLCDWETTRNDKLRDHIRKHHPDWALNSGFARQDEIDKCKLLRGPKPRVADKESPPKPKERQPRKHPRGHVFKCDMEGCSYETLKHSKFQDHMNSHLGIKNHMCSVCGRAFTLKRDVTRHEMLHFNAKPFKCKLCEWTGTRSHRLKDHVRRAHSEWALQTGYATQQEIDKAKQPQPYKPRVKKPKPAEPPQPGMQVNHVPMMPSIFEPPMPDYPIPNPGQTHQPPHSTTSMAAFPNQEPYWYVIASDTLNS